MPYKSKWVSYRDEIVELLKEHDYKVYTVSRILGKKAGIKARNGGNVLGSYIHKVENRTHVEYLRSANDTDSWHHVKGYQHTPRGVECFVHDLFNGQIGSFFD